MLADDLARIEAAAREGADVSHHLDKIEQQLARAEEKILRCTQGSPLVSTTDRSVQLAAS